MPISKINTGAIHTDAITNAKLADDVVGNDELAPNIELTGEYLKVPVGTTAQRPGTPADGMLRFNTDFNKLEQYSAATSTWSAIDTPPSIISLSYPNSLTAVDPAGGETVTLSGTNFQSGAIVSIDNTDCTTTFVDSTSLTFVTPAKTAGDYDVVVTNSNGLTATLTSGITFNGVPAFTSPAAGKIGSDLLPSTAITTITIVAAEPDGGTLAYSITSGSLPTGLSLNSSNGEITGTTPSPSGDTNFPFTVTATDDENQTNTRNYSLTVLAPVYNHEITNSLFIGGSSADDDFYQTLSSTHSSWTLSYWVKRLGDNNNSGIEYLYCWGPGTSGPGGGIFSDSWSGGINSTWSVIHYAIGGGSRGDEAEHNLIDQKWQHHVLSVNNNVMSLYVNGVLDESFTGGSSDNNSSLQDYLVFGRWHDDSYHWEGMFADMYLVTGSALTASSFGQTRNNTWVPKAYTGSYGTEGWHLDFSNSSNLFEDSGDNNITFTSGGGAGLQQYVSSPTNDVAVLAYPTSREVNANAYYYYGELLGSYYTSGNYGHGYSNISLPESGKWYYEFKSQTQSGDGNVVVAGIVNLDKFRYNYAESNSSLYADGQFHGFFVNDYLTQYYRPYSGGSVVGEGQTSISFTDNTIFQVAIDLDAGKMWLGLDGTWLNSGNPETGTNPSVTFSTGQLSNTRTRSNRYLASCMTTRSSDQANGQRIWMNFGAKSFDQTIPSGYKKISTTNIEEFENFSVIEGEYAEDHCGVVTYVGAGSGQTVNTTCQPDMVWIKDRTSGSYSFRNFDPTRVISGTYAPQYFRDLTSFTNYANSDSITPSSTSFTTGRVNAGGSGDASGGIDTSGVVYSAYYWKLGGAAVSNPDGNLSSTISANPTSGVSAVRYTGNAQSGQTIGHGLGTKPDVAIIKDMNLGTYNWWVWSRYDSGDAGGTGFYSGINTQPANSGNNAAAYYPNLDPIFESVGDTTCQLNDSGSYGNGSGHEFVTWFFSEREGFSRFGYYESNNDSNYNEGPIVRTGFKPEIVIIFDRGGSANWIIFSDENGDRSGVSDRKSNPKDYPQFMGLSNAESQETSRAVNFLSDGFQPYHNANDTNGTAGNKYFYMAFAKHPTKYTAGQG